MTKLTILRYPDPRLKTVAKPVTHVDERIAMLVSDMIETMYAADGIGLAATQVDVHEQLIVMDTSGTRTEPRVLINPELLSMSDEQVVGEEGCLSVPTIFDKVTRAARIRVRALDREGRQVEFEADELLSKCIQHEMDHLRGKVFVDYLSMLKRTRIKTKLLKQAQDEGR
ncbi:MAG: peptide deformylase [Burkholderiales bacterium 28-67-8]|nr:MAG: peptide deformylase [Burkholderiales bacterium 28-67-8]